MDIAKRWPSSCPLISRIWVSHASQLCDNDIDIAQNAFFCCHKRTILIGIFYISIFLLFRRRWGFPIASPNFVFEQLEAESIPIVLPLAPLGSRFLLLVAPVDSKYRRKHLKAEPLNPHFVHLTSKHTWIIWGILDAEKRVYLRIPGESISDESFIKGRSGVHWYVKRLVEKLVICHCVADV